MNKIELLEKMGKLPPSDLGLSKGEHYCPFCGAKLGFYQYHNCLKEERYGEKEK
jgi:hypothetical protein